MDFELLLFDRIKVIRETVAKYGEDRFYLSFSGGKDSAVLHRLLDLAVPGNEIPRVFINTGIEYSDIVAYVKGLAAEDPRFFIIPPKKPIKAILEEYGYPFKSKEHAFYLGVYQRNGLTKTSADYLGLGEKKRFLCPKCLRYQFSPDFNLKVSDRCCKELKKEPAAEWARANGKAIAITGMRSGEGGVRASKAKGCAVFDGKGRLRKFHPLMPVPTEFEDWFIEREGIRLCRLYYPPFNFKRTGCKGCPFNLELQKALDEMAELLPAEARQCEAIWAPVYAEYRRIGYRLRKKEETDNG